MRIFNQVHTKGTGYGSDDVKVLIHSLTSITRNVKHFVRLTCGPLTAQEDHKNWAEMDYKRNKGRNNVALKPN